MAQLHEGMLRAIESLLQQFQEDGENADFFNLLVGAVVQHLSSRFPGCGSRVPYTRVPNLLRDREMYHHFLIKDYFAEQPTYPDHLFRRRFRMRRGIFLRVEEALVLNNSFFQQKRDAAGLLGLSSTQKMTAALRMLAYDKSADELDEHLRLAETTVIQCLREFCRSVGEVFGPHYLHSPTPTDLHRILQHSSNRDFPGMAGSLDCMHWEWKNCPVSWAGQYTNRKGRHKVLLEAVATHDLWIWHSYFGSPGSLNDRNVLDNSPIFHDLLVGKAPNADYRINNQLFRQTYYLVDGMYPPWPVFQHTIPDAVDPKRSYFAMRQKAAQQDVERTFEVLRQCWHVTRHPLKLWQVADLRDIMLTCIILHNMIVEDEQSDVMDVTTFDEYQIRPGNPNPAQAHWRTGMPAFRAAWQTMTNETAYHFLQNHLVEHLHTACMRRRAGGNNL